MTAPTPIDPEKVAIALAYEEGAGEAPRVVAKGRGAVAEKIIALGEEHGVVIQGSPVLAAALSKVELDESIPEELFKAVAEVIAFVLRAKGRR